jgi:hydrogenase expression/formation protein HypC
MCLAIPARLVEVDGDRGVVELGGSRRAVGLALVSDPRPGQYVLVHAGFAIEVIDEADARELNSLHRAILEAGDGA